MYTMITTLQVAVFCAALLGVATANTERQIREFQGGVGGIEKVMFAEYAKLTDGLTKPAIIKGFFDASDFREVCACSNSTTFFDSLNFPYTGSGNPSHEFRKAHQEGKHMQFNAVNGGEFFRNNACPKDRDDYIFYDVNNGALMSASVQDFFKEKMDPLLQVPAKIGDEVEYDEWFNEIFIGGSTKEYPLPGKNGSGSAPHRAPVLNYYHQVCGKKRWYIAPHHASFGEKDKYQVLTEEDDMHAYMNDSQVLVGYTEPGDLLLNPPWLWHFVQTDRGFNYAVTYKQIRFPWWAAVNKMDPTLVAANMENGLHDLRNQKIPLRHLKQKNLGGQGLYGAKGAFILDVFDFRMPMWLLKTYQVEISVLLYISVITYLALAVVCCVSCCWCLRRNIREEGSRVALMKNTHAPHE